MQLMESTSLFESVYHDTTRGVACAQHLTICFSVFHDQYHPPHKGKAMETFEGTILDFSR
jgi:hypothetical protein